MMKPVSIEEHRALERQEDVDHLMREAISMHSEAISMHSEAISMHSSDRRMSYRTTSEHHLMREAISMHSEAISMHSSDRRMSIT